MIPLPASTPSILISYFLLFTRERLVQCYVVVVVVATQTYVAHVVRRQKTVVAVTTKGKNVPQDAANVPRFHVVAAAIHHVLNVQFFAIVTHAHAFKCMI